MQRAVDMCAAVSTSLGPTMTPDPLPPVPSGKVTEMETTAEYGYAPLCGTLTTDVMANP